jgi:hypothetical protein
MKYRVVRRVEIELIFDEIEADSAEEAEDISAHEDEDEKNELSNAVCSVLRLAGA